MDQLEDLEAGLLGGRDESSLLVVGEVGGDGDDGGVDWLSGEVSGGLDETLDEAAGDLGDGHVGWLALLLVLDGESNCVLLLFWVCRGVGVGWVYRLEPGPD